MTPKGKSYEKNHLALQHLESLVKYPDFSLIEWLSMSVQLNVTVPDRLSGKLLDAAIHLEDAQPLVARVLGQGAKQKAWGKTKWCVRISIRVHLN